MNHTTTNRMFVGFFGGRILGILVKIKFIETEKLS
jgi:hypothetical protein